MMLILGSVVLFIVLALVLSFFESVAENRRKEESKLKSDANSKSGH